MMMMMMFAAIGAHSVQTAASCPLKNNMNADRRSHKRRICAPAAAPTPSAVTDSLVLRGAAVGFPRLGLIPR